MNRPPSGSEVDVFKKHLEEPIGPSVSEARTISVIESTLFAMLYFQSPL